MPRWTYIIPRIIILLLVFLAVWVGADPLSRNVVVQRMQQATKSKVDVGTLRWNLSDQKLLLKDIAVGDHRFPMRNLFQADMIFVDLDWPSLLNRNVVINHGQTSRLMFGTPRTNSGVLPGHEIAETPTPYRPLAIAVGTLPPYGQRWLDKLTPLPEPSSLEPQELDAAIATLNRKWTPELDKVDRQLIQLGKRTRDFGQQVKTDAENPLRWKLNPQIALRDASQDVVKLGGRITELQQQIQQDLQSLDNVSQVKAGDLKQTVDATPFDAQDVSNLLLARQHALYVDEAVNLVRWFQQTMPNPADDFTIEGNRGVDIPLGGKPLPPAFVIKEIELNGEAEMFQQRFNFSGLAKNLSSQPERNDQPSRIELRAQGDQHVVLTCTLDRRDPNHPEDRFQLVCPSLAIGEFELGEQKSLALQLGSDTRLQANFDLTVSGQQVAGTIQLNFSNIGLRAQNVADMAGGDEARTLINDSLAAVDQFQSTITIDGTLDQYQHQARSSLGQKFSSAVNQMLVSNRQQEIQRQLKRLQKTREAKISALSQSLGSRLSKSHQQWLKNRSQIADLQLSVPSDSRLKRR